MNTTKNDKKTPSLFEVKIESTDDKKAGDFISKLNSKDFIRHNKIYLQNYINADLAIAFSHIKNSYKTYVCSGGWEEDKFEGVVFVIAKRREMLTPKTFMKYGIMYDEGKLTKEIDLERRKYKNNEEEKDEEAELLAYIAKHGGVK